MTNERPFIFSATWHLDQAMVTGRYSRGLVQLFDAHVANGTANIFQIFREIAGMEGASTARPSGTKPASPFTGRWLKGLWHKHYTQARFMPQNLGLHWRRNRDRISDLVDEAFRGRSALDQQCTMCTMDLSRRLVHDGYLERAGNSELTGEWIVFAKQDGVNYYLTLGEHGDDEAIWRRCKSCAAEFASLRILQENR